MRLDKLTTKFQEALGEAQSLALGNDHAYIEPEHLLVAMLRQEDGPRALLQRAGVNVQGLLAGAEAAMHKRPKVEGHEQVVDSLVIDTTELGITSDGELLCFLELAPSATLAEVEPQLREALRAELSPRHVPDRFVVVGEIPHTLNGKKCEVPVKRILAGEPLERVVSAGSLANPGSLGFFVEFAQRLRER